MCSLAFSKSPPSRGYDYRPVWSPVSGERAGKKAIWADLKEVHDAGGISVGDRWAIGTNALNIPLDQLSARINANPKGRFIYPARQVTPTRELHQKLKLPGIHLRGRVSPTIRPAK